MSHNRFYTNYCGSNSTFHDFRYPPPNYPPPAPVTKEISDEEFVKKFEAHIVPHKPKMNLSAVKIFQIKEVLSSLVCLHTNVKEEEKKLVQNMSHLPEDDWQSAINTIVNKKNEIDSIINNLQNSHLDLGKKLIAKRIAKRMRLKRLKAERKKEREENKKKLEEKSRKIDENLQKIQDGIMRAKQAEEDKLQADVVLRDTLRKKHDAKKNIVNLEALVKLRKARLNTVKGMGKTVSEAETGTFLDNIEKLKKLWEYKLVIYLQEEQDLRSKLEQSSKLAADVTKTDVINNLVEWKVAMFGDNVNPQVDFNGNLQQFIAVRSSWDRYIDDGSESTPIPVGWVTPAPKT